METFKDMCKEIKNIADKYFAYKRDLAKTSLTSNTIDEENPYRFYIIKVNEAYEKLSSLERSIINNDFFYQNYEKWWEGILSEETYIKYKKKAMVDFLRNLNECN